VKVNGGAARALGVKVGDKVRFVSPRPVAGVPGGGAA
jgi:hypothetical protein